jgi:uncharacterized membrane protein YdbT with pleckstrin-like domain
MIGNIMALAVTLCIVAWTIAGIIVMVRYWWNRQPND